MVGFSGPPHNINLKYEKDGEGSYVAQIETGFKKLVESHPELRKRFVEYEVPIVDGRYDSNPTVHSLVLSESKDVYNDDMGGEATFKKTIVLYYRFTLGHHRGQETRSGFFAVFNITGHVKYEHVKNDDFKLAHSIVTAEFEGFRRQLNAPEPTPEGSEPPAEQDGGGNAPEPPPHPSTARPKARATP